MPRTNFWRYAEYLKKKYAKEEGGGLSGLGQLVLANELSAIKEYLEWLKVSKKEAK